MAVFGRDRSREDDPARAVRAALAMQQVLIALNQELARSQNPQLQMRIGINSGLVIAARLGGDAPGDHQAVLGDAVNLAARLEGAAPPGGVLIGQATYDQVRGLFDVEAQPPLTVKGKTEPVQAYIVLREKPRAFRLPTRGLAGVVTRTVGRDAELARLQAAYRRSRQGELRWITISGEAGVGKSRLLAEFEGWLERQPTPTRSFKGRAWPHTAHTPYFLLRDLLSFHFQIHDSDALTLARQRLAAGLGQTLGAELGAEAAAFIGQLIGLDFSRSPWIAPIADDTRQIRGRAEVLLRQYLARLCADEPTVWLLEDLHWADRESLALLADLLAEPQPWRLCVIGLTRPEFWGSGGWEEKPPPHHDRLDLAPLPGEMAHALVLELLQKAPDVPDWLVALLIERGAGNPYFIEELVHWLIEQQVIEPGPEVWRIHPDRWQGLRVPVTVQGVLQARLNHLHRRELTILQRAAVLGRTFWADAVAYIGQEPVAEADWQGLQQRDLIFKQTSSQLPAEDEYLFKHALLRDVVYEYTLKKVRRTYHRRAAEWLLGLTAERSQEWTPLIAQHYELAGDMGQAATWYGRAARQAQATDAPQAAIKYCRKALAALPPPTQADAQQTAAQIALLEQLAVLLRNQTHYVEALDTLASMRQVAEISHDRRALSRAWRRAGEIHGRQGDLAAALSDLRRAEAIARAIGPSARIELAQALTEQGMTAYRTGDAETTLAKGEQALALVGDGELKIVAESQKIMGAAHWILGNYDETDRYFRRVLTLCQQIGDRRMQQRAWNNLGANAYMRGDYEGAATLFREALNIAEEIGDRDSQILSLSNLGGALVGQGDYDEAETCLYRAIQIAPTSGWYELAHARRFLAQVYLGQGRFREAQASALEALHLAEEMHAQDIAGQAWRTLGVAVATSGQPAVIRGQTYHPTDCFAASLRIVDVTGAAGERGRTLRAWARYELEAGDPGRGERLWQEALAVFDRLGLALEVERMMEAGARP